jgi:hypothetical protein
MPTVDLRSVGRPLVLLALAMGTASIACVEAPFERVNPNDREFAGTISVISSRDTISPANPIVVFKVVTDPVVTGYEPRWVILTGEGVTHVGSGVFQLTVMPNTPTPVTIAARFQDRMVSRTIIRAPAP